MSPRVSQAFVFGVLAPCGRIKNLSFWKLAPRYTALRLFLTARECIARTASLRLEFAISVHYLIPDHGMDHIVQSLETTKSDPIARITSVLS